MEGVVEELNARPLNENTCAQALSQHFMRFCKEEQNVPRVVNTPNLVVNLLHIAETMCPRPIAINALVCLVNLAIFPASHKILLENHSLDIALKNLHLLRDNATDNELDCGLSSASLIIRLVGNQESGPGPAAIKGNPVLLDKLSWVLKSVLETGYCLGFRWDPANILLDVATLCASDRNKPLMIHFVPLLALAMDDPYNFRVVKFSAAALSQLMFEPKCKSAILLEADRIKTNFTRINVMEDYSDEPERTSVNKEISSLLTSLEDLKNPPAPKKPVPRLRLSLVQKLMGSNKDNSPKHREGHIMISYNWGAQPIAISLQECLSKAGYRTWFDLNDMGENINDSMAFAVENAWLVVVLFSQKYKESANCRKECEMADSLGKSMIFVKVQPEYHQEAWLGLVMGKALYIECFNPDQVKDVWPQLERRVEKVANPNNTKVGSTPVKAVESAVVSSPRYQEEEVVAGSNSSVLGLLQELVVMVKELKQENAELKASLAAIEEKLNV